MDANTLKAQGNAAFKEGRFCLAVRRYTQGLAACCSRSPQEGAPAGHADRALRAALYTNRAACYLALQYPEPAFEDCNSALRLDPNNVKALFRKAQGLMAFEDPTALGRPLQHLQEALEAATAAAVLAPQDSAVQRVLKEAQAACAASTAPPLLDVRTSVQVNRGTNSSAASAVLIPQVPGLKITEHVINHLGPAWAWLQGDLRIAASALELLGRLPPGDRRRPVDVYHTNRTLVHSLNASEATHRPDPFLLDSALAADYRALFALLERRWGAPAAGLRWVHFRSLGRDFIDDNEAQGADRGLAEGGGLAQLLFFSVQTLQRGPEGDGDREEWVARCEGSLVSLTLAPEFRGRPVCLNAGAGEPEAILDRHKVRYTQELDGEMVCFFEYFKDLSPEEVCLLLRWNAASGPPDANAPAGLAKADVYLFWSCLRHFGSVDAALRYAALAAAEVALPPAAAAAKAEGNAHFRAKEYKRAVAAYSAALRDTPAGTLHAATLLTNRAAAYLQLRKEEKAADDCTQALAVHPRHPKALYRRACAYRAMRRWDECVADAVCLDVSTAEVLQLLLELDPGSPVRGHYKWLGAGGAGVNMAVVGQLRACSLCGAQEPFPHKFRRCGRCKSVRYCGEACQRRAWKEHKLVCGKVPEDMASVVVLPHQEGQKYYGHHVPKGLEAARAAIAGLMQAAAEDVEAFQPVRGEAELIRDVVLFQARRTALARGLGQNVRGSIILTPLSAGGLFTKSDADGAALGPVVVARLAPSGAELVDLPVKEFQGLWGMMTLIPLGDGQCAGIVLPKTKAAEQDLAAVLQAGLAGLERRAEAHTP